VCDWSSDVCSSDLSVGRDGRLRDVVDEQHEVRVPDVGRIVVHGDDTADIGNPHLVLFVDDVAQAPVTTDGPRLEHDPRFPNRTNVEFVKITGPDEITMRVWERGVGETLSCGTGACAAAAVAHRHGLVGEHVVVKVTGGDLVVDLGDTVRLGGPVVHVFDVDVDLDALLEGDRTA